MKISPGALFNKWNALMLAALKPLGVWGIGGLAVIDSAAIPVPIDALLIDYVASDHRRFLLYCFMAAVGSGIGSLLPYYLGRSTDSGTSRCATGLRSRSFSPSWFRR